MIYPCCFLLRRDLASCLRIVHRLLGYQCHQGRWAFFLHCERLDAVLAHFLVRLFRQDHTFSQHGRADDRFHNAGAQCVHVIPSSVSLDPPTSSPYLDANEETGVRVTGSLGCWS